jgi:pantetheine-phosphate adenylyltransferase
MAEKIAVIPGSFDPVTVGHKDVIVRAAALFDKVYVAVMYNSEKAGFFDISHRLALMNAVIDSLRAEGVTNVAAEKCEGLAADFIRSHGAGYIVKGVRGTVDFEYEHGIALIMKDFCPEAETVFLPAAAKYIHITSTYVRERLKYGAPLEGTVPPETVELMKKMTEARKGKNNEAH